MESVTGHTRDLESNTCIVLHIVLPLPTPEPAVVADQLPRRILGTHLATHFKFSAPFDPLFTTTTMRRVDDESYGSTQFNELLPFSSVPSTFLQFLLYDDSNPTDITASTLAFFLSKIKLLLALQVSLRWHPDQLSRKLSSLTRMMYPTRTEYLVGSNTPAGRYRKTLRMK